MGTRNLTCVFINGEYKVAQYCQWDGYPSVQGVRVLSFLRGEKVEDRKHYMTKKPIYKIGEVLYEKESFKQSVLNCKFIDWAEVDVRWKKTTANCSGSVSLDEEEEMEKKYPQLVRNMGALILPYIQKHGGIELTDSIEFSGDSLFCEWAYVIDYDTNVLEVYKGFVKHTHNGRFAKFFAKKDPKHEGSCQYYPIELIKSWDLDNLPTEKEFLQALTEEEEC